MITGEIQNCLSFLDLCQLLLIANIFRLKIKHVQFAFTINYEQQLGLGKWSLSL